MNEQKLANQLEALLDEELSARGRTTAIINEQIETLREKDRAAFGECIQRMENELASNSVRGQRRAQIVAALAGQWGSAPTALTLSSIATRLGDAGNASPKSARPCVKSSRASSGPTAG